MQQLDTLSVRWRRAIDAAEDAVLALGNCNVQLQFAPDELRGRAGRLVHERGDTEEMLESLAHMTHARLHRRLTGPRANVELLGLDRETTACVFDLDGVLTASSALHAAAWEETFDELLARHFESLHEHYGPWRPFDTQRDYLRYIHGRPRIEGVHSFLASRGIRLPEGDPGDAPGAETAFGLANRKNEALQRRLSSDGVSAFEGAISFLEVAREADMRTAVVSASANTDAILERAGLDALVDEVVDGNVINAEALARKPAPDWVLEACERLHVTPEHVTTFETTRDGIDAGHAAGVHRVIGVDRLGRADELREQGADRVVADLGDLIDPVLR